MNTLKICALAAFSMLVAQPLAAQEAGTFDCLMNSEDENFSAAYLEDFIQEQMGRKPSRALRDQLSEVASACLENSPYPTKDDESYSLAMLAYMLRTEAQGRIETTSFPIALLDEAVAASIADPSMNPGDYMDNKTAIYDEATRDLADELGVSGEYAQSLVMVYVMGQHQLLLVSEQF